MPDLAPPLHADSLPPAVQGHLLRLASRLYDAIMLLDADWRITYANPMAMRISHLTPDDITTAGFNKKTFWQQYPGVLESPLGQAYLEAVATQAEREVRGFYYEPFNTTFDVRIFPMEGGVGVHYRDVTSQKKGEQELRDSEARYRLLTELSPQSQWTASPEGLVLYANQRFLEYIGHQFVPRTGNEYIACFDPADRARVVEVWTHSVLTGEDYNIEARLLRASDGASRWWHLRALPLRDEHGAIQQWLGTANDIHETRTANDRLREQYAETDRRRREVETIYNSSPIGMALYEPTELRLLHINRQQAQIFGLAHREAIGKTFAELTSGTTTSLALISRAAAGEAVLDQNIEGTLANRPTEHRYWNVNYSPIFAEDGSVRAIAGATIETTRQKQAELALIQSEKLAAVGRMASSIAHEINNPLEAVTNLLFLARSHAANPEVQTFLDLADQELRRVSIIANQTLRFHKQATNPREITCTELFATVLSLYEGRLKNSSITVINRKRTPRAILCFEGDIRQVLNNLVGNAIDAMSTQAATPGGNRLILRSRTSTERSAARQPRHGITLTIADTGPGIDPATQARIFDAFFTTKGIAGTGLGLWISKEIIDRHHGTLRVRSSQNPARHGTVFTLFLPFASTPTTADSETH